VVCDAPYRRARRSALNRDDAYSIRDDRECAAAPALLESRRRKYGGRGAVPKLRDTAAMRAVAIFIGTMFGGAALCGAGFAGTRPPTAPVSAAAPGAGAQTAVAAADTSAPPVGPDAAARMASQCLERSKSNGWPPFS